MYNKQLVEILKSHVCKLSNEIGNRSVFEYKRLNQAAEYIIKQFKNMGYEVQFQNYFIHGREAKNIIAIKKGKFPAEIIIGAHYDTCFNPGADDNASGIAVLLEVARKLAKKDTELNIKFIAFVNEEPPFFKTDQMGSYVYANHAKENNDYRYCFL